MSIEKASINVLLGAHGDNNWDNVYKSEAIIRASLEQDNKSRALILLESSNLDFISAVSALKSSLVANGDVVASILNIPIEMIPYKDHIISYMFSMPENIHNMVQLQEIGELRKSFGNRVLVTHECSSQEDVEHNIGRRVFIDKMTFTSFDMLFDGSIKDAMDLYFRMIGIEADWHIDREETVVGFIDGAVEFLTDSGIEISDIFIMFGSAHSSLTERFKTICGNTISNYVDDLEFEETPRETLLTKLMRNRDINISDLEIFKSLIGEFILTYLTDDNNSDYHIHEAISFANSFMCVSDIKQFKKMINKYGFTEAFSRQLSRI
jgi:hypothetical protein